MIKALRRKEAPQAENRFASLRINHGAKTGSNLGGKYALPPEFPSDKYASAFFAEGPESLAAQQDQPVLGTEFVAPGWSVWRYPGALEKAKKKTKKDKTDVAELSDGAHPLAGKPHKIVDGSNTYVLHYRPREIQDDVNLAYALHSTDELVSEVKGESLALDPSQRNGILTSQDLSARGDRDLEAEKEFEQSRMGTSAVVHGSSSDGSYKIKKPKIKVSQ